MLTSPDVCAGLSGESEVRGVDLGFGFGAVGGDVVEGSVCHCGGVVCGLALS